MNDRPLVTVGICAYNSEAFIRDTINSVLRQTYQNLEIIIVDDCSKDNTVDVIKEYEDKRIKLIELPQNMHVCNAANTYFRNANGKYIAPIGHDDMWKEDKIEKQVQFMEEYSECSVCYTWADLIDENNNNVNNVFTAVTERFQTNNREREKWVRDLILHGNTLCAPSAMIRKEIIDEIGAYDYSLVQLQDYDLWLRILMKSDIYILEDKLTLYRRFVHSDANLSADSNEKNRRVINETNYVIDRIIEKIDDDLFLKAFRNELLNSSIEDKVDVKCEKLLLRVRLGNGMASYRLMEAINDKECRERLGSKYGVSLQDFYRNNTNLIFMSNEIYAIINDQNEKIRSQMQLIEEMKNLLDK